MCISHDVHTGQPCALCVCEQKSKENGEQEEKTGKSAQLCWSQSQWTEREVYHYPMVSFVISALYPSFCLVFHLYGKYILLLFSSWSTWKDYRITLALSCFIYLKGVTIAFSFFHTAEDVWDLHIKCVGLMVNDWCSLQVSGSYDRSSQVGGWSDQSSKHNYCSPTAHITVGWRTQALELTGR